jgi:hypothetical protein
MDWYCAKQSLYQIAGNVIASDSGSCTQDIRPDVGKWDGSRSCQQPVNAKHGYNSCCLYRVNPPDDEQQACSKQVEVYYWNKLIKNSASCWFMLYGYITMHGQQNIK